MANPTIISRATTHPAAKRHRFSDDHHHSLLPGLPDHIAQLCLSFISPSVLYSVCRSWRHLIYSASFPPFRSIYTLSLPTGGRHNQTLELNTFDPISSKWIPIDSPPLPYSRLSVQHPSFVSQNLPVQSVSVAGNLVILAATSVHRNSSIPAFPNPLIFNPLSNTWSAGPPLSTPRRWCAAGVLNDTVIVASGIGSQYTQTVAHSVEKLVFRKTDKKRGDSISNWEKLRCLKHAKLCREAIDAVGWKRKLCMVNVKGDFTKEGFVYDVDSDEWVEMPVGMLGGWRGPATAMDEETMYVVDESRGVLKRYNEVEDNWSEVMVDERLKGAEYIAAGGGKVCVVCENDVGILVVDVVATPPRLWVLDTPAGNEIVALHILPRMSLPES